ncbi:MAG: tRNA 2-thiouridine(34) synthase MnmA [Desulfobaccales bacterium]
MHRNQTLRVAVALSGGVDSAMAAHLLKQQGVKVWGVHLLLGEHALIPETLPALAERLGIPYVTLDLRAEFAHLVVDYFVEQYFRGRTPNPCIRCNAVIKFGVVWERVRALGASHLATGHYVRLKPGPDGQLWLYRGVDAAKDQSYFLCRLPREVVPHLLFPLGELTKGEVRRLAQELGLTSWTSCHESQDICFIPKGGCQDFLSRRRGRRDSSGELVDRRGHVLGRHQGVEHFTVGQRRGLGTPAREPLYVLAIQPECNRVVIGPRRELFSRGLIAAEMNWLREPPGPELRATAVIRYRHPGVPASLRLTNRHSLEVIFDTPQAAVTPGQAVAFYDEDCLWGGAWIEGRLD